MKKIEEVLNMPKVRFADVRNLKGRLFYSGEPTDCMMLRILQGKSDGFLDTSFICGIDRWQLKSGAYVWATTLGFWGNDIMSLVSKIARYYVDLDFKEENYALYVCDDTPPTQTGEYDEWGDPVEEINRTYLEDGEEKDRALRDMEEIVFD